MDTAPARLARERVMADLKTLADDAEAMLRATAGDASDTARDARARLSAALNKAKATYQDLQARGLDTAKEALRKTDDTIRAHPYESIGLALGLGVLIGVLLPRR